jgi:hypothetical protein
MRATMSAALSIPGVKGTTSGRTFVRRKWSGQVVPSALSSAQRALPTNSSTSGESR